MNVGPTRPAKADLLVPPERHHLCTYQCGRILAFKTCKAKLPYINLAYDTSVMHPCCWMLSLFLVRGARFGATLRFTVSLAPLAQADVHV